jgi:Lactonase, 7-bladed beta-propeller
VDTGKYGGKVPFRKARRTVALLAVLLSCCVVTVAAQTTNTVPAYRVDPAWPKPLPNHWVLGVVVGVAVDRQDHVWIVHRPSSVETYGRKWIWSAAPPVLEFAPDGTLLSSWGGPGTGFEWPEAEHGIYVDRQDHVWLGGAGKNDAQILKFTREGKFLLQIGHQGKSRGSNDTENLGGAAIMVVDEAANELYVADGYINHRVIVFDATTGAYKRHWGAYGKRPEDSGAAQHENASSQNDAAGSAPSQFSLVHSVRISNDGFVYVCDRTNDRVQVFRKDGTFVQEAFFGKDTVGSGSASDIGFSVDSQQRFAFVVDEVNQQVYVIDRKSLKILGTFGGAGHWAGQFEIAHNMAVDSKGDIFITEAMGKRVQKFVQAETAKH